MQRGLIDHRAGEKRLAVVERRDGEARAFSLCELLSFDMPLSLLLPVRTICTPCSMYQSCLF